EHTVSFQIDETAARRLAQRCAIVLQELDIAELKDAAQRAGLDALDVVHVAEDPRDWLRLIAARVADWVTDEIDWPSFQRRRRLCEQGEGGRRPGSLLGRLDLQQRQIISIMHAQDAANAVVGAGHVLVLRPVIHPGSDAGPELPRGRAVVDE